MLESGSEFRNSDVLKPLWEKHKHWQHINTIITDGLSYPLEEVLEETRLADLEYMMARNNYKSVANPKINARTL